MSEVIAKKTGIEKLMDELVGCDVVLDPTASGMLVDTISGISLSFFGSGKDRTTITKDMQVSSIMRNIVKGILRVEKNGVDITTKFGGKVHNVDWKRTPIVSGAVKREALDTDKPLLGVLNRTKEAEIVRDINSIKSYGMLARLKDLEEMGKNPVSVGRSEILKAITNAMKRISGVTEVRKISESKPDIISAR